VNSHAFLTLRPTSLGSWGRQRRQQPNQIHQYQQLIETNQNDLRWSLICFLIFCHIFGGDRSFTQKKLPDSPVISWQTAMAMASALLATVDPLPASIPVKAMPRCAFSCPVEI
jgi:hypothetical protein